MAYFEPIREIDEAPLVEPGSKLSDITNDISRVSETKAPRGWWIAFGISSMFASMFVASVGYLFYRGIGVWGNTSPVYWAWDITNFVWWVGIGHAGTLISAVLFLFRQKWRTAINRFAEAMTLFAVICALIFPSIHVGRPWLLYWVFPVPNKMSLWPNFKSPLLWDVFAVSTYFTVSLLFWFVGLIPDLATLRDRSTTKVRRTVYGALALGWRGSNRHWQNYERAYLILAALSTPLVLSVHSVVSWDFAVSVVPGWHSTLFPPYFVAGAIFSGVAMVITLLLPIRRALKLTEVITMKHLDLLSRLVLLTSLILTFSYATEFILALRAGPSPELSTLLYRATGAFAPLFWTMVVCNCLLPLLLFFRRVRGSQWGLLCVCICVNVGMWLERFNIVVSSLEHNRIPFDWATYHPRLAELGITVGSFGWFFFWFLLFLRLLPSVSIAELKEELASGHGGGAHDA